VDVVLVAIEWLVVGGLVALLVVFATLVYGGAANPPWLLAMLHFLVRWMRLRGAAESTRRDGA
jgi:hypothetical protein